MNESERERERESSLSFVAAANRAHLQSLVCPLTSTDEYVLFKTVTINATAGLAPVAKGAVKQGRATQPPGMGGWEAGSRGGRGVGGGGKERATGEYHF